MDIEPARGLAANPALTEISILRENSLAWLLLLMVVRVCCIVVGII